MRWLWEKCMGNFDLVILLKSLLDDRGQTMAGGLICLEC